MGRLDQLSRGGQAAWLARGAADWLIDGTEMHFEDPSLYRLFTDECGVSGRVRRR